MSAPQTRITKTATITFPGTTVVLAELYAALEKATQDVGLDARVSFRHSTPDRPGESSQLVVTVTSR